MLLQVLLNQREALHARIVHLEKSRSGSVISAHTAIEGSGDAGIAANSSRPGGSTLAQSVVKPHALTGGQQVGAGEIGAVSALSSAAGVLFVSHNLGFLVLAVKDPYLPLGILLVGFLWSCFAWSPRSGAVRVLLRSKSWPRNARESAAVDVGSTVGLGNMSGWQV